MSSFPRVSVGGISLPRLLIGSNWLVGFSHTSSAADNLIRQHHATRESIAELLEVYLAYGIDAIMAVFEKNSLLMEGVKLAEAHTGKKLILIDTPIIDVSDSHQGRLAAEERIRSSRELGCTFCLPHHSSVEKLVCKLRGTIDRLPDYLDMIRQQGLIPGLSAHMPELVLYSDEQGYDVETYIQIYNCLGFLMQVEVEYISKVIWNARKPVMTIKSMAAGRVSPYVGLNFSFATLRPCDMVTLGAFTPNEVHEDVEIALAAIERRYPNLSGRSSPNKTVALGGKG